ncbi:MAG: ABC transporter ATP-binding protein [Clostridia bacterium]|nr:ABC transporter ATP-binding protein [Clostridia bacterium]
MKKKNNVIKYFSKYKGVIALYCILFPIGCVFDIILDMLFAYALTMITQTQYNIAMNYLVLAMIFVVVSRLLWFFSSYLYHKYINIMSSEMSHDLTNQVFKISNTTFSENSTGEFVQRIASDPRSLLDNFSNIVDVIGGILSACIAVFFILFNNWIVGVVYIVILSVMFVVETKYQKIRKPRKRELRKMSDKNQSLYNEIIRSEQDIKALNLETELGKLSKDQIDSYAKFNYTVRMKDTRYFSIKEIIINLISCLILLLGLYLTQKNMLTLTIFILIYTYKDRLYNIIYYMGTLGQTLTDISVLSDRMFSLYDEEIYPIDKFGTQKLEDIKGNITFEKVNFAYNELIEEENEETNKKQKKKKKQKIKRKRIKKEPIFKDLSFSIKENSTVAFVGRSGSGKSTILSLIAKFMEVDSGEIKIDGYNIKDISKESLRENIALINQFPYIFDMTIKENLKLVNPLATDEDLIKALKESGFYNDIESMPKGIETRVGESGLKLSGGQRQRLAISRAILKNSKIMLFDESTSSLDNFTQQIVQNTIEDLKGSRTIIIVAHRLSTIKNVDKIYFLEKGNIVDSGTFEELYNNNETFKAMFLIENSN